MTAVTAPAPLTIVAAVARHLAAEVTAAGDRVYAGRAPGELGPESAPYLEVSHVSGPTPTARGDGETLAYTALVQADGYEIASAESPAFAASILAAVSGKRVDELAGSGRWRVDLEQAQRIDADDEPGWIRHRIDVRITINR